MESKGLKASTEKTLFLEGVLAAAQVELDPTKEPEIWVREALKTIAFSHPKACQVIIVFRMKP